MIAATVTSQIAGAGLIIAYLLVVGMIGVYGRHRYWLVLLYCRHRRRRPRPLARYADLPRVTVQLPMFNERHVAERIIDAACSLDYPRDRLQVQVLDDSTDASAGIAERRVRHWQGRGVDVIYLHRAQRAGFKAGALDAGLQHATGELIAIFDADFVPGADFLRHCVHHFTDPDVGMVQARWSHLNRDDSLLTRCQAVFLDGHFLVEHAARNWSGRWMNFNGTAGVWRRSAIESAGGWQHDTLTEDVDLSYRAQLAGWRFVFRSDVTCPAELPPHISAFKTQQHRWTKGSIQTARKLLPRLLRSDAPWRVKVEAFFHLTSPMVYLCVTLLAVMFYPTFTTRAQPCDDGTWAALMWGMTLFALGTASAGAYYTVSQRVQRRGLWGTLAYLPALMAVGVGIAVNNARACIEALIGHESPFVRTPKYSTATRASEDSAPRRRIRSARAWMPLLEIALGAYMLACAVMSLEHPRTIASIPFLLIFAAGYLYIGIGGALEARATPGDPHMDATSRAPTELALSAGPHGRA